MIVTDNDNKPSTMDSVDHKDSPPPYVGTRDGRASSDAEPANVDLNSDLPALPPTTNSPSSSRRRSTANPPQKPASNFVIMKRQNNGITDSFVIDTQLHVPEGLVSPIAQESKDVYEDGLISGERPHIYVESVHGHVNADIWLVRGPARTISHEPGQDVKADLPKSITDDRALINVKSTNGSVNTKLYCETEQPYILCCSSKHGSVTVLLPSSFVGPATFTTTYGKVVLSPAVHEKCTTFSEINNVRTCFIGDYGTAGFRSLNEWKGSILQLSSTHGKIKVQFIDELAQEEEESRTGFSWSKLFPWK